jgi:hypothetical protein
MKKTISKLVFAVTLPLFSHAQLATPINSAPDVPIIDSAMVLQIGQRSVEIISGKRALPVSKDIFSLRESSSDFSKDVVGVAYDHTLKNYLFFTGLISFKLNSNSSISNLPTSISIHSDLIIKPDIYTISTKSPSELINTYNILKSNKFIDWVEPISRRGILQ